MRKIFFKKKDIVARWQKGTMKICIGTFTLQCSRGWVFTIRHETVVEKLIGVHYHMFN